MLLLLLEQAGTEAVADCRQQCEVCRGRGTLLIQATDSSSHRLPHALISQHRDRKIETERELGLVSRLCSAASASSCIHLKQLRDLLLPSSIPQAFYTSSSSSLSCLSSVSYARCCLFCLCLFFVGFFFGFICKRNMNKTNEFSLQRCWLSLFCKFLVLFTVLLHLKLAAFSARFP